MVRIAQNIIYEQALLIDMHLYASLNDQVSKGNVLMN